MASPPFLGDQRKVIKRETTPLGACRAAPDKSVSRGRAFRQYLGQPLMRRLNSGIHAIAVCGQKESSSCRLRACRPYPPPHRALRRAVRLSGSHSVPRYGTAAKAHVQVAKSKRKCSQFEQTRARPRMSQFGQEGTVVASFMPPKSGHWKLALTLNLRPSQPPLQGADYDRLVRG